MKNISIQLNTVLGDINKYEKSHGRIPGSVKLLAVSKTKPIADIQHAIDSGQLDFGENYLGEAVEKINALKNKGCIWHFIGKIQSNKTRAIAQNFDWVHTIDRLKIAKRLGAQRPEGFIPINCCVQINIDNEDSKAGIAAVDAEEFISLVSAISGLSMRGIMVIPATKYSYTEQVSTFSRVHDLFRQLQNSFPSIDTLSMGMSGDIEAAVANGSTIVRVGTAIFGKR